MSTSSQDSANPELSKTNPADFLPPRQMSWPETESGGVFLEGSVDELFSLDDQGDLVVASESSPFLLGGLGEFEHHGEAGATRAVAFGSAVPESDGGKGRFDWVGRSQMSTVFGREVVEGEQDVTVLVESLAGFGILRSVLFEEVV